VILDPLTRNTENVNLYPSLVSSQILSPLRFRCIDHPVDDTEERPAFFLVQRCPPLQQCSFPWCILRQFRTIVSIVFPWRSQWGSNQRFRRGSRCRYRCHSMDVRLLLEPHPAVANQPRIPLPRCKQTATPISDIPSSINASESATEVATEKAPTTTPTIENNHRIMRSPPPIASRLGCRPAFRPKNMQISHLYRSIEIYTKSIHRPVVGATNS